MAIERVTVIDQIEITRKGDVQVRIGLLLVENGTEIDCKWHRTLVNEDADIDATFAAVNSHLTEQMGCNPVSGAEINRVKQFTAFNADLKAEAAASAAAAQTQGKI